jgi:hypothetical protein
MPAILDHEPRRTPVPAKQSVSRLQRDLAYLSRHRDSFAKDYMDEYVAVFNQKLVAHSGDLKKLIAQLRAKAIPVQEVVVDFLTDETRALIL